MDMHLRKAVILTLLACTLQRASASQTMLSDGVTVKNVVGQCNAYTYFYINVENPCKDLSLQVVPVVGGAIAYVSSVVNTPTSETLTWSNYHTGDTTLVISHWDRDYTGGTVHIGVYTSCDNLFVKPYFNIQASLLQAEDHPQDISATYQALNQNMTANSYDYFRFCVPYSCSDVRVTLSNCLYYDECPLTYAYPELLVSRLDEMPAIHSYTWKLAQIERRYVEIDHTNYFYSAGHYFVAVYGWCTPDEYCGNTTDCGPCSNVNRALYNLTVSVTKQNDGACNSSSTVYEQPDSNTKAMTIGKTVTSLAKLLQCNSYTYFSVDVENPCYELNIQVDTIDGEPDLYVGKWPVVRPTLENLTFTSYNWGSENLTLNHLDPGFVGGYNCGKDGRSLCTYYLGVLAYCGNDSLGANVSAKFNVTVRVQEDILSPFEYKYYYFCAPNSQQILEIDLLNFDDGCSCPYNYSSPEVIISSLPDPDLTSYAIKLEHGSGHISLNTSQLGLSGHYYTAVYGWCTPDYLCSDATICTCSPCSNYNRSGGSFALLPRYENASLKYTELKSRHWGTCVTNGTCESFSECENQCTYSSAITSKCTGTTQDSSSTSDSKRLTNGEVAAVVLCTFLGTGILVWGLTTAYFYNEKKRLGKLYARTESEIVDLNAVPRTRTTAV